MKRLPKGLLETVLLGIGASISLLVWISPGIRIASRLQASVQLGSVAKSVDIYPEHSVDAVRVTDVSEDGTTLRPGKYRKPYIAGEKLEAGDNWLSKLSFTLTNETANRIVYMRLILSFPEDEHIGGPRVFWPIELGRIPENAVYLPNGKKRPQGSEDAIDFEPGQELTVALKDQAPNIRGKLEQYKPFSAFTKCVISVDAVYFPDGMKWSNYGFGYAVPDSNQLGQWVRKDPYYFPGIPSTQPDE